MTEGCLGPHEAKMCLNASMWSTCSVPGITRLTGDMKPKLGQVQRTYFTNDNPPPFYDPTAAVQSSGGQGKAQTRGTANVGYAEKAKGMKQAL